MGETRCYKCGRLAPASKSMAKRLKALPGGDGWCPPQEATVIEYPGGVPGNIVSRKIILGVDQSVLCPRCREQKEETDE